MDVVFVLCSSELRLFGIRALERWQSQLFEMVQQKNLRGFGQPPAVVHFSSTANDPLVQAVT